MTRNSIIGADTGGDSPEFNIEGIEAAAISLHKQYAKGRLNINWNKQLPEYRDHMRDRARMAVAAYQKALAVVAAEHAPDSDLEAVEAVEAARRVVEAFAWAAGYKPRKDRPERDAYHVARAFLSVRETMEECANDICRDVCELPDRTSPEDQPDMLMVTTDELHAIVIERLRSIRSLSRE